MADQVESSVEISDEGLLKRFGVLLYTHEDMSDKKIKRFSQKARQASSLVKMRRGLSLMYDDLLHLRSSADKSEQQQYIYNIAFDCWITSEFRKKALSEIKDPSTLIPKHKEYFDLIEHMPGTPIELFNLWIRLNETIEQENAIDENNRPLLAEEVEQSVISIFQDPNLMLEAILHAHDNQIVDEDTGSNQIRAQEINPIPRFLQLANSAIYHRTQEIIARGKFSLDGGEKWPTGRIEENGLTADVQIKPDPATVEPYLQGESLAEWQTIAANTALEMNDETADVLDYITFEVVTQANGSDQDVIFSSYRFNQLRGIKKQKSGEGRRGGFKTEYRRNFARCVDHLSNTWIRVSEMEVFEPGKNGKRVKSKKRGLESRAIVVSARAGQLTIGGQLNADTYRGRLGPLFAEAVFGTWRQTALVSVKALGYDHYHQRWEKRLTRYLSWQWRIRQGMGNYLQPFDVATLLDAIGEEVNQTKPLRTKERLEKALDTLLNDEVIAGWQYCEGWDENIVGHRGWAAQWQAWKAVIEPPQEIFDQYKSISRIEAKKPKELQATTKPLGELLRNVRLSRCLSQLQAAEEIGINQATLSRIEKGANVRPNIRRKIEGWLSSVPCEHA